MENMDKQIRKLIKLHKDCAEYYRYCAEITTEEDLIELFNSLALQRDKMAHALAANMPANTVHELWLLKDVLPYLRQAWHHMKMALIINNRKQILQYSFKNEQAILREYELMANRAELPNEIFRHGIHHQQMLKESLQQISNLPTTKYSRQRNSVGYVMGENG